MNEHNRLTKKKFFERVAKDYFDDFTMNINDLSETIKSVAPIFGKLEVNIEELENGNKRVGFIDKDVADVVISSKSEEVDEKELDMSTRVLALTIDSNNSVKTVEHGISFLTPANKELILFFGCLINKKLEL